MALVLMQFFDMRSGVNGRPGVFSAYLIGFCLLSLLTVPFWVTRLRELTRTGWAMLLLGVLLFARALVSTLTGRMPRMLAPHLVLTRRFLVVPVLTDRKSVV